MARSCFILADYYDAVSACHSREVSRARTQRLVREASGATTTPGQGRRIKRLPQTGSIQHFSVRVSLSAVAGIELEPVGFRVKSDLRNHRAIVHWQPCLYDHCLMVTQIALSGTQSEDFTGIASWRLTSGSVEVRPPGS